MRLLPILLLTLSLPLSADPPDGTAESLAPLLKRLDAEDFDEREAASRDLERWVDAAGDAGEALLAKAREGASPEVDARLAAAIAIYADAREGRKYLGRYFDAAGLPPVAGTTWVVFNTGERLGPGTSVEPPLVNGWILSKTERRLVLLEDDFQVHTRSRKVKYPAEGEKPAAGKYRKADFARDCRKWLEVRASDPVSWGDEPYVAKTMLYGWWAFERGLLRLGVACVARVKADAEALPQFMQEPKDTPAELLLATCVAEQLRRAAVFSATEGRARGELLVLWKGIAALPDHPWSAEAAQYVMDYASLLKEDAVWVEPSKEELGKLDGAGQARYWIHHLRDNQVVQDTYPPRERRMGALKKLVSVGWDAVPELIAHVDDRRPVRHLGYEDDWHPEDTWYLRCIADCCFDALEAITSLDLDIWSKDRKAARGSEGWRHARSIAARAWWARAEKQTVEERLFEIMVDSPYSAARQLLKRDAARHMPALLREAAENTPRTPELVRALAPSLGKEHREFLEGFLKSPDPGFVLLVAATLLDRCGADSGARRIVELVDAVVAEPEVELNGWLENSVIFILRVPGDFAVEAVARWTRHPARYARLNAVLRCGTVRDPRIARALAALLDDRAPDGTGITRGTTQVKPRWCDAAARSLSGLLFEPVKFDMMAPEGERDAAIAKLKEWWIANEEKVDWDALKQRGK